MDIETLRGIVELMEKHDLTHVKLDGGKVEIDRASKTPEPPAAPAPMAVPAFYGMPAPMGAAPMAAPAAAAPGAPAPAAAPATPAPAAAPATPAEAPAAADDTVEVAAPMVGVFYAAPAPGADPFVKVGSKVKRGDTLCIVEAMKCMNEIAAEQDGVVVDICVSDGELVEYGRCLMKLS